MAGVSKKNKPRGGKDSKTMSGEFSLEFIQDLGGTKEDLRLLADIDDEDSDEDLIIPAHDFDTEPIKKEELYSFIQELGLKDYRPVDGKETKKPKKLLKAPVLEDSDDDTQESQSGPSATEKQKKKTEKNKFKTEDKTPDQNQSKTGKKEKKNKSKESENSTAQNENATVKKKKEKNKFKVQHNEVSSTTPIGMEDLLNHLKTHSQRPYLLVKAGDAWLDEQAGSAVVETTRNLVAQCEQFAAKLLEHEVTLYKRQRENTKRGETNWIKTVLSSGTLSDKMAALTVLVQESPAHNISALDMLVNMAKKKGKREAMLASDTLKNLFTSETSPLPDDRRLTPFDARPFSTLWQTCSGNRDNVDRRLVMWHAEDLLRQKYAAFVKALDVMSYDTLVATKEKALAIMHSLLTGRPEQENVLLPMLVNKLGDPNYRIASKASYLLIKLVEEHPNMKCVIVGEVEQLVYRPNVTERAQYYAMCFLNQIKLHKSDHALATQLISIYFTFFKVCVKKGEADSKMMAALLTGVNRAYPYAKVKRDFMSEQMATLYKIVHIINFNTSIQALMLLYHVIDSSNSESDRFFMALYRKLLDPGLRSSAKQPQFLNLLYKSMKADVVEKRVKAFVKRLLQAGSVLGPNFLCGALIVISEVLRERPNLLGIRQVGKSSGTDLDMDDEEEERFVDLPLPPEFQESSTAESREEKAEPVEGVKPETQTGGSWLHRHNLTEQQDYNRYQRNPLHSHAQHECLWELQSLTHHFHPSVSLFAQTVLRGEAIEYSSDPLQDFTLIRFLDRFVYKNPKKKEAEQKRSETVGTASGKRAKVADSVPVNSAEFLQGGEEAVPEHERYLYRYFSQKAEKKKEEEEASDVDSVSDTEFDAFLDRHERQVDHDDLDDMDFGLDFAGKLGGKKKGDKRKSKADSDEDMSDDDDDNEDDDDDDFGGLSDEEIDFGDDDDDGLAAEFRQEMEGLGDMDEEEGDIEDKDLSGDELKQMMSSGKKRGSDDEFDDRPAKKKSRKNDLASMFAAADDFADMLEGNADAALTSAGTWDAMSNNDKASAKQIAWEAKRERQSCGKNWRDKKHRGGKFFKSGHKKKRKM